MERLTEHHVNKTLGAYMVCSGACIKEDFDCTLCENLNKIVNTLAAYEDTGLEPEEIKAVINGAVEELSEYDELMPKHSIKELARTDKDGRMVVLPSPANDPLTMTELLKMEGEPVWVTYKDGSGGRWGIVNIYPAGICADVCAGLAYWFEDHIGTIAYRRKPEGETNGDSN